MFVNKHCYFPLTHLLRNSGLWNENTKLNETSCFLELMMESLLQISKLQAKKEKTRLLFYIDVSKVLSEHRGGCRERLILKGVTEKTSLRSGHRAESGQQEALGELR